MLIMAIFPLKLLFLIVNSLLLSLGAALTSVEFDLISDLTHPTNYDVNSRPVTSSQDPVNVTIDVALQQIIDLVSFVMI